MTACHLDEAAILAALRSVVQPDDDFVVLHSSLFAFRVPGEDLKWPLLGALRRLSEAGHTLALPSFTFSFCRDGRFDLRHTKSGTGVLADWLLELEGARRSHHPIYSFALLGPRAEEVLACRSSSSFADDSPFGLFDRNQTRLVMLGCGWEYCTQLHRYEQLATVPYRMDKEFVGTADLGAGPKPCTARFFVRDITLDPEPVNDFSSAFGALRDAGAIASCDLAAGRIESVDCADLAGACGKILDADPYAFVEQPRRVAYALEQRARQKDQEPLRLGLIGAANLDLLRGSLERSLPALFRDRQVEVHVPPFGQAERELRLPGSPLAAFGPDVLVYADRLEDLLGLDSLNEVNTDLGDAVERYVELVRTGVESLDARALVLGFAALQAPVDGEADSGRALVAEANRRLAEKLSSESRATIIDLQGEAARFENGPVVDNRLWFLGRLPFSQGFTDRLADKIVGGLLALTGRTARLLVLDLDNTLWGGVLGEDGVAGLQLGGDYPGNAFKHFQKVLKRLGERGIALALASKNDHDDALGAIAGHPDMVLREDDFAALRIDWNDKPGNLQAMAEELSLGLETIAFVDDNPAERARMRLALPEVKVIELPDDPARYAETLLASPWLECLALTDEDRGRAKRYAQRRKIESHRQQFDRPEDFYAHLRPRLHVAPLSDGNAARAEQLCQKTNQFNTTGQRYSRADLERLQAEGQGVYVLGLEDRYSERENIGLLVVHWGAAEAEIDLFLLSCRVLGRGVEAGSLAWLAAEARARGLGILAGRIVELPRNTPARGVFADLGFVQSREGSWQLKLTPGALPQPDWLQVNDELPRSEHAA